LIERVSLCGTRLIHCWITGECVSVRGLCGGIDICFALCGVLSAFLCPTHGLVQRCGLGAESGVGRIFILLAVELFIVARLLHGTCLGLLQPAHSPGQCV
jgi:hypothetical protein